MHMLDLVLKLLPEDSKEPQTARILLYKLFYDQTDQGLTQFLLNLFRSFDTHKQPKRFAIPNFVLISLVSWCSGCSGGLNNKLVTQLAGLMYDRKVQSACERFSADLFVLVEDTFSCSLIMFLFSLVVASCSISTIFRGLWTVILDLKLFSCSF